MPAATPRRIPKNCYVATWSITNYINIERRLTLPISCYHGHRLRIHRCATRCRRLWFHYLTWYVISTRISGKYTSSNFNTNVLRKTGFRRFVGDQVENINSFVSWNIQDNLLSWIFVNQGNLAESFLKIVVYLTFPHLIPY